jgi:hypothetical protein
MTQFSLGPLKNLIANDPALQELFKDYQVNKPKKQICLSCKKQIRIGQEISDSCDAVNGWHIIHKSCTISERLKKLKKG